MTEQAIVETGNSVAEISSARTSGPCRRGATGCRQPARTTPRRPGSLRP